LTNLLQQLLIRRVVGQVMAIDVLPDDVLLGIFDFCVNKDPAGLSDLFAETFTESAKKKIEAWQPLVHVCRRWRSLVFGSPHRLNLRLSCTAKTPARDTLDVWPALPLILDRAYQRGALDDIISILERSDRLCQIHLNIRASEWEKISAAMQQPFPELTFLWLNTDKMVTVLPDSFLGGSAPRLRWLWLDGIPFPGLSKLLLSATHLTSLLLSNIPQFGHISPEAMVTTLSMLTSLDELYLDFASPRSRPDQESRRPPSMTRSVLSVLTKLIFKGVSEYLDDLVARIDAPRLFQLDITFFNDIVFDTRQIIQFISHTPMLKALEESRVTFGNGTAGVKLLSQTAGFRLLNMKISCREPDWQVSSLGQVCTSCLPPLATLEDLYIHEHPYPQPYWQGNIENTLWLELSHPFTTVKNLYLSRTFAPRIVPALQELVGGRTTEVLPSLQNIFLEELEASGPVQEGIGEFVAARQVTGHPIAVSRWDNSEQDIIDW
jgi:hypothetical protein